MQDPERHFVFVYGLLLQGESEHSLLSTSHFLGEARTAAAFTLVDLNVYPALVVGGTTAIVGELYDVQPSTRLTLDIRHECPVLFHRIDVTLEDGRVTETYAMSDAQVRGKRRIHNGSWRNRFAPRPRSGPPSPFAQFARQRSGRG